MKFLPVICTCLAILCTSLMKPHSNPALPAEKNKVVFAVIDDGSIIEPIVIAVNNKLVPAIGSEAGSMELPEFASMYYQPNTKYHLITGGKVSGSATVVSNDPSSECSPAMATVTTTSARIKLKGQEYALATNINPGKAAPGTRRAATVAEKTAISKLAASEFRKNKSSVRMLKAVKLTILDTDQEPGQEITGTYSVSPSATERGLLFFIASKTPKGEYAIRFSEYHAIRQDEVMSGDIKDVDDGIYQEMLLDVLDTDNSGSARIFTMRLSFEGVGFHIYKKQGKQWLRETEVSNYHCGY